MTSQDVTYKITCGNNRSVCANRIGDDQAAAAVAAHTPYARDLHVQILPITVVRKSMRAI